MPSAGFADVTESNSLGGTATLISGSVATVVGVHAINTTAAAAYIQLFDAATVGAVTLGTTIPRWVVKSQANDISDPHSIPVNGIVFRKGLVAASLTSPLGSTGAIQHVRIAIV